MIQPNSLWRSWLIVGSLVFVAGAVAWRTGGPARVGQGLMSGSTLFLEVLPSLILGFALAGFLYVLLPTDLVSRWMGSQSGWRGVMVGTVAGMVTPGGPFTHFPILASLLSRGAAVGPVCAYIAAWALIGLNRIVVWELPILGPRLTLVRFLASVGIPPLIGCLGGWLYRILFTPPTG